MTTLDLDRAWTIARPNALALRIDGNVYPLRRITVADVRRIATFSEHAEADNAAWLAGLFEGEPPAFVRDLAKAAEGPQRSGEDRDDDETAERNFKVLCVVDAIGAYYVERCSLGKRLTAAAGNLREQIQATAATASSGSSST